MHVADAWSTLDSAGDGRLTGREQTDLTTCEAALDNLRMAFWAAGKALQIIP